MVPWNLVLKLIWPDFVLAGPMNNARDPGTKTQTRKTCCCAAIQTHT